MFTPSLHARCASAAEIKRSYKKLALAYHPDKHKASDAEQQVGAYSLGLLGKKSTMAASFWRLSCCMQAFSV